MESGLPVREKKYELAKLLVRRSGRSTRIIDSSVQALFTEGIVSISDHKESMSEWIMKKTIDRLAREHGYSVVEFKFGESLKPEVIGFDREKCIIQMWWYGGENPDEKFRRSVEEKLKEL